MWIEAQPWEINRALISAAVGNYAPKPTPTMARDLNKNGRRENELVLSTISYSASISTTREYS